VSNLSGGNQQKVVLAKWLATRPSILILDEPTRGIDVGAKAEIYDLIDSLAKEGMSTIVISSDLPEIMRICDTVYVMRNGRTIAQFTRNELDQEQIIRYATGVNVNEN
jgi:ribose transport system ATP-binding protein